MKRGDRRSPLFIHYRISLLVIEVECEIDLGTGVL